MCGIAGILNIGLGSKPSMDALKSMISLIHHRGPDGYGYFSDSDIGLAHARLSIIDIEGGKQPIHNTNSSVWVVFNGEIFNYIELRSELKKKGYSFYTQTDTEVIVHLYDEYGDNFVNYLNGQFAIALWDSKLKKLILTRDRVGITPLFYSQYNNQLYFSSEIKSILKVSPNNKTLNINALDQLFTFWSPVSPNTLFTSIKEVSPGEILVIQNGQIKSDKYWSWLPPAHNEYSILSEEDLAQELEELLVDATKIRLRSDVPVAAYLSGGLDSSILVSTIKNFSNTPLRTFSIEFDDSSLDESKYQNELIKYLDTDHSKIKCYSSDIADNFMDTIWHTEMPILRSAPVPMSLLSGLVHESKYKVVLTGEGADEAFGGYDIFKETKIRQFWAKNKDSNFRPALLKKLYPYLDVSPGRAQVYLQNFFGQGISEPNLNIFSHIPRWNTTSKIKNFYSQDMSSQLNKNAIETLEETFDSRMSTWHSFNKAQYIESKTLMSGYLLCSQGDRMLMKNSVEGRFPFLDHRLIEFSHKLHPKYKMKGLTEKYLLKKAMGKYIPQSIVNRYKQPYRAPDIPSFIEEKNNEYVFDLLSKKKIDDFGYFDSNKISLLLKKIKAGKAIGYKDNMAFMGVLSTQALHELFISSFDK